MTEKMSISVQKDNYVLCGISLSSIILN